MNTTTDIVAKLWNLCHTLRDDGVTYHQYVTELTYLLFLKMAQETKAEDGIPVGYRWADLLAIEGIEQLTFYREQLLHLGTKAGGRVQAIYANAQTALRQPRNLARLVKSIDGLAWFDAREEGLGDLYEGLLEKNANEKKSGAGQYFTPRALIDCMVALIDPQPGEVISDPAAGTLGFIVAASQTMKDAHDDYFELSTAEQEFQKTKAFYAVELVPDTHRLALMNGMLHGLECEVHLGDSLSPLGARLPASDVILTNPPFGTKRGGGRPSRDDFTYPTSNKQLAFLQHIYRNLKPGGRAAVVLPDNVLFEDGTGQKIRADLMDKCDLHTILRLPTGIFYAQGVKTNVLFFEKGVGRDTGCTSAVWFYDLRTNMPTFGKRTPFTREVFRDRLRLPEAAGGDEVPGYVVAFEDVYSGERRDLGEESRWRCYSREAIAGRGDNLDVTWLRDESVERVEDLGEPEEIAGEILGLLEGAVEEIRGLMELLEGGARDEGDAAEQATK